MALLRRAVLTDFRNYARLHYEPAPGVSVITGPNGSGKTNLLEAISLLMPGRGLRGARPEALPRDGEGAWAVAARIETEDGPHDLGTGVPPAGARGESGATRRLFRLDGAPVRAAGDIAPLLPSVWLTPQMERLWGEQPSGRRRFLDRLVAGLEPSHARAIAAHDASVQGRNRLLLERRGERAWLAAAEDGIARHAVAATASRLALCRRLNGWRDSDDDGFPAADLRLIDPIADRLAGEPARVVEDWIRVALAASREADAASGATRLGAHRADLAISDRATGLDASRASTGQQKALLVGLVLAHAALIGADRGAAPMLLLDEPLVHLDLPRRNALFRALLAEPRRQVLLTGTDPGPFASLAATATLFTTGGDAVVPARW